jgi:hypothetical protein
MPGNFAGSTISASNRLGPPIVSVSVPFAVLCSGDANSVVSVPTTWPS